MYLEVLGKLGPSLIWRQIESHTFWCCGKLGPWKNLVRQIGPLHIGHTPKDIYPPTQGGGIYIYWRCECTL